MSVIILIKSTRHVPVHNRILPPILLRIHRRRLRAHLRQPGRSLRLSKSRSGHLLHGSPQARAHHEIRGPRGHGRYPRHLRHDRRRHHRPKKYFPPHTVTPDYSDKSAYAHLASGLCCGFSSLVKKRLFRLQVWRSVSWETLVCGPTPNRIKSLWEWFWFWFSEKPWHSTDWSSLWSSHRSDMPWFRQQSH